MSGKGSIHFGYQLPIITWIVNYHATHCSLCWFSLINEYKTKKNFVTQCVNFNFSKIILSSYLAQWYSMLTKVTCPMNVHEFQCWHRSLLFHERIGFETAVLDVSFFFSKWIFQHTGNTPSLFWYLRRPISNRTFLILSL